MNRIWQKFPFKMDPKNKYLFSLSLFFCLPVWGIADQGKAPNAKEIIDAHIRCRKMIQTLSCSVKQLGKQLNKNNEYDVIEKEARLDYWFNGSFVLAKNTDEHGRKFTTVWHKNEKKSLSSSDFGKDGKVMWGAQRSSSEEPYWDRADPFFASNYAIAPPGQTLPIRLESLLRRAQGDPQVIGLTSPGRVVLRLVVPHGEGKNEKKELVDLHFNPKKNHIIEMVEYRQNGAKSSPYRTHIIDEFQEPIPGIYFAKTSRINTGGNKENPVFAIETTIRDLEINEPMDSSLFDLQFPNNIIMNDTINRTKYVIDEDGNPISKPHVMPSGPPPELAPGVPTQQGRSQTKTESYLGYLWLPGFGLVLIVVGLALYFFKGRFA